MNIRRGGVFGGLGEVPMTRFPLVPGIALNPAALATQTVLAKVYGFENLKQDGKWGDCSQSALQNITGTSKPTQQNVSDILDLGPTGIKPSEIQLWDKPGTTGKGLYCTDKSDQMTTPSQPAKGIPLPAMMIASKMGMPTAPFEKTCTDMGMVASPAEGLCLCPQGAYLDQQTFQCVQTEQPVTDKTPPGSGTPSTFKLPGSGTITVKPPTTQVPGGLKFIKPALNLTGLRAVRPSPIVTAAAADAVAKAQAAADQGGKLKLALVVVALAAAAGGAWWWFKGRKAKANRRRRSWRKCYRRNCGEWVKVN